jgi:succinate dehydrogenase/fumarate reductase flavoprotein subunit
LHYQNGGVAIKPDGSTNVPNLYVAGEAAGGIHGRNRLMGNSLLDICVFGRHAGLAAASHAKEYTNGATLTLDHIERWNKERAEAGLRDGVVAPMILPDYVRHVR